MKTIYNKYDKNKINALPQVLFPGKIVVVQSESEADKAVDYLLSCDIMGVDTETKPSFKKGHMHKVALIQVSTREVCFLFRLNFIGMPPSVIRLLSNTTVPMIGLSWHDDICSLHRRTDFTPGLFIDIQNIVGRIGIEDLSLQKLYANIFGEKISKRQRLTNWEADVLNEKQKRYAATDAWACINLYQEILRLEAEGDFKLVKVKEKPVEAATPNDAARDKEESPKDVSSEAALNDAALNDKKASSKENQLTLLEMLAKAKESLAKAKEEMARVKEAYAKAKDNLAKVKEEMAKAKAEEAKVKDKEVKPKATKPKAKRLAAAKVESETTEVKVKEQ